MKVQSSRDQMYSLWIQGNERRNTETRELEYRPLISVVVPVYNIEKELLEACVGSVLEQTYTNWELILVDDCSSMPGVRETLKQYETDPRIRILLREQNGGISRATNTGIEQASGEFIAFLDCDDVLSVHALFAVADLLNRERELDFIYSDEDKLSEDGMCRKSPFFKPDWSPDTLLSLNYTNHLSVFRTSIVRAVGGLRPAFDGSQDYDLTLRFTEQIPASHIGHIAEILYHWRERGGSAADDEEAKPYALDANRRAKAEALERRGIQAELIYDSQVFQQRVVYQTAGEPMVSIIIPSKDNLPCLKKCLDSLEQHTAYRNYEIILVDNGSCPEVRSELEQLTDARGIRYIYEPMIFNFSRMCNRGAAEAKGDFLLFLNDDIEAFQDEWLGIMLGQAMQEWTGAVGAKLYYPDSRMIQHTGVVNLDVGPAHILCHKIDNKRYYFDRNTLPYNYSAVTGACLMVARKKFEEIGRMNENMPVTYNDVDLCFSLYDRGYFNVLRPDACLYHHESVSRGNDLIDEEKLRRLNHEKEILYSRHESLRTGDPFYNVNLVGNKDDFSLKMNYPMQSTRNYRWSRQVPGVFFNMGIVIDEILIEENIIVIGWVTAEDREMDDHGHFSLLLEAGGGQFLEIEAQKFVRADAAELVDGGSENLGFICVFPRPVLFNQHSRIGMIARYGDRVIHGWSLTYLDFPGFCIHAANPVSQAEKNGWVRKDMFSSIDSLVLRPGVFSIRGWAFEKDELYNCKCALWIYLESGEQSFLVDTDREERPDVCRSFRDIPNLLFCGFRTECTIPEDFDVSCASVYVIAEELDTNTRVYHKLTLPGQGK